MKILFITGSLNQGGAEYQILELAKLFKENGHDVEVFAITDYEFYKPFIKSNEIRYSHLLNDQSKFKRVYLTSKKIRTFKPNLIFSYIRSTSQVALIAKLLSLTKTRLIIGERTALVVPKYDTYYFNLMRLANFITVNSISKLEYIRTNFPKLNKKVNFFPNIIDIVNFDYILKKYDSKVLKIGFIGRISPEKNVLSLVEAISHLNHTESVQLYIYGDARNNDYFKKVNDLIESLNLSEKVFIQGKSNEIKSVYKEIDLLCLISDFEGFSNVIAESLSSGLPVITSNIPENKYLIQDKINGFVVDHKDSKDIARGIENYIRLSPKLKLAMAKSNREKAERIFNRDEIYNSYMKVINTI